MRSLLISLEQRLGHLAIPNLIRVLAMFQVVNWLLVKVRPEFPQMLLLVPAKVGDGEWWRLFSYILLPGSDHVLWLICLSLIFAFNDGLEEAWGSFRLNLYILACIALNSAGAMVFGYITAGSMIWASVLFAFACYFPNEEILLFLVILVRVKWIALLGALGLPVVLLVPGMRAEVACSLLPFLVIFAPSFVKGLRHMGTVQMRRQRYARAQVPASEPLYRCARCQRTDRENPALEFRVNADGDDVCHECRAKG